MILGVNFWFCEFLCILLILKLAKTRAVSNLHVFN